MALVHESLNSIFLQFTECSLQFPTFSVSPGVSPVPCPPSVASCLGFADVPEGFGGDATGRGDGGVLLGRAQPDALRQVLAAVAQPPKYCGVRPYGVVVEKCWKKLGENLLMGREFLSSSRTLVIDLFL